MVGLGNVPNVDATARANHTGTQDASTIGSGTLDFQRLPFTVTYPVRAVHAGGVLSFDNWAVYTTPTYYWGGSYGDLRTLATMEFPATSVSVDVSVSATKYIADNPGRVLTYAALEIVLVDAANRIVGWGTTSTNPAVTSSNGTAGTSMTVSLFAFPSVPASSWVIGGLPTSGNVTDITPIAAYKKVASRWLDIEKHEWANVVNPPATYAPSSHNQAWSTITSTPTTLAGYGITDGVATSDTRLASNGNKGDITVSSNGSAWTINAGAVVTADIADSAVTTAKLADASVTDAKISAVAAGKLTGTVQADRLGSGTASSSTFLRGDQTWASVSVPLATTTTAGGVIVPASSGLSVNASGSVSAAFATTTQALTAPTQVFSTPSAVSSPASVLRQMTKWRHVDMALSTAVAVSGGLADSTAGSCRVNASGNTAGTALLRLPNTGFLIGGYTNTLYAAGNYWNAPQAFCIRISGSSVAGAGPAVRFQIGKGETTIGRMTTAGIGFELYYISNFVTGITLLAHNGTTLTAQNTGITYTLATADIVLVSDGTGNVSIIFNDGNTTGSPVTTFTMTGGPTSGSAPAFTAEATNGGSGTGVGMQFGRYIYGTSNSA
jgi:hypothetical protein